MHGESHEWTIEALFEKAWKRLQYLDLKKHKNETNIYIQMYMHTKEININIFSAYTY